MSKAAPKGIENILFCTSACNFWVFRHMWIATAVKSCALSCLLSWVWESPVLVQILVALHASTCQFRLYFRWNSESKIPNNQQLLWSLISIAPPASNMGSPHTAVSYRVELRAIHDSWNLKKKCIFWWLCSVQAQKGWLQNRVSCRFGPSLRFHKDQESGGHSRSRLSSATLALLALFSAVPKSPFFVI